jgi:hypothetical protein
MSGPRMASRDPPLGNRRPLFVGQRVDCENPGLSPGAATALAADHGGYGQSISKHPLLAARCTLHSPQLPRSEDQAVRNRTGCWNIPAWWA